MQAALAHPDKINSQRVAAQEARRAMDRVVGFPLSNLLGKKVAGGLSAGRVQSVAVKLIVDREREIEAFRTEEYWKITAMLAAQAGMAVSWVSDPKKSKIFAKQKEAPKLTVKPGEEPDTTPDPDEPVVDTGRRAEAPGRAEAVASGEPGASATEKWAASKSARAYVPRGTREVGTMPSRSSATRPKRTPSSRGWRASRSS